MTAKWPVVFRYSKADWLLLLVCMCLLAGIRLSLWVLPFQTLRRMTHTAGHLFASTRPARNQPMDRIVWAITVASRYVPRASCLTQALAAQVLLQRHGVATDLRIGLARSEQGQLQGHAWLEHNNQVIIGNSDLQRFTRLTIKDAQS